jgi:putative transposase
MDGVSGIVDSVATGACFRTTSGRDVGTVKSSGLGQPCPYEPTCESLKRCRFRPAVIQEAVWLCHRFNLSHRDIEDLLAERGVEVSYESVRLWCNKFGPHFSRRLRRKHSGFGDTFFIDEVFVKIAGQRHCLWRAVDQDGEVVDVYLQARRDAEAARRFFRRLLRSHGKGPWKIVTDRLGSYGVARREPMPAAIHDTGRYANNRAELSHQPTPARERGMRLPQNFCSSNAVNSSVPISGAQSRSALSHGAWTRALFRARAVSSNSQCARLGESPVRRWSVSGWAPRSKKTGFRPTRTGSGYRALGQSGW